MTASTDSAIHNPQSEAPTHPPATTADVLGQKEPEGKTTWQGTNLAGDQVEQGIRKHRKDVQDDLRWAWRFAAAQGWSQAQIGQEFGDVSPAVISRVFRGEYNVVAGYPKIPTSMLSAIRMRRQVESDRAKQRVDRVLTPTTAMLSDFLHKPAGRDAEGHPVPGQKRLMGIITGDSHCSKTHSLEWYRERFNHGRTVFVDMQDVNGVQELYREFARNLQLSDATAPTKLKDRIVRAISPTTLVLVDELHHITHAYQKKSAARMLNALKSIKDRSGCAMVVCGTTVVDEEFAATAHDGKLLEQIKRRATDRQLRLPKAIPVYDIRTICLARGLLFPAPPGDNGVKLDPYGIARRKQKGAIVNADTWEALRKSAAGTEFQRPVEVMEEIAYHHGILSVFTTISDGMILARQQKRELTWDDVITAYEINQATKFQINV